MRKQYEWRDAEILWYRYGQVVMKPVVALYEGDLMVHKDVACLGMWTVSHIHSGYAIVDAPSVATALQCARAIQAKYSFDPDKAPAEAPAEMKDWLQGVQAMAWTNK